MARRNSDCQEIIGGIQLGEKLLDPVSQFHHVFWFGDLNYRIDLPMLDGHKREKEAHWAEVIEMVEKEDWPTLLRADQLKKELGEGACLTHFTEGTLDFPPTYKLDELEGFHYTETKHRPPAWCDRVLRRTMPGLENTIKMDSFVPVPEVFTSDHKPVRATYTVTIHDIPDISKTASENCPILGFTGLKGAKLVVADLTTSDPYIMMFSDPPGLFTGVKAVKEGHHPKTAVKNNTLDPVWDKPGDVPLLFLHCENAIELGRCHVILSIYDSDRLSQNDPMGNVVLSLDAIMEACGDGTHGEVAFDEPVIFNVRFSVGGGWGARVRVRP